MAVERRPDGTTRGGNEPPDEVQDTPRQNAGYDAAVRGERTDEVADEGDEADAAGDRTSDEVTPPFRPPADTAAEGRRRLRAGSIGRRRAATHVQSAACRLSLHAGSKPAGCCGSRRLCRWPSA